MPIIRSMMANMTKQYGAKKGKNVYYAVEAQKKKEGKLRSMLASARKHHDLA